MRLHMDCVNFCVAPRCLVRQAGDPEARDAIISETILPSGLPVASPQGTLWAGQGRVPFAALPDRVALHLSNGLLIRVLSLSPVSQSRDHPPDPRPPRPS